MTRSSPGFKESLDKCLETPQHMGSFWGSKSSELETGGDSSVVPALLLLTHLPRVMVKKSEDLDTAVLQSLCKTSEKERNLFQLMLWIENIPWKLRNTERSTKKTEGLEMFLWWPRSDLLLSE